MQPWTGGRRERERERRSSVVGKLSAMVRRGSLFQADPEDVRGSRSSSSSRLSHSSRSSSSSKGEAEDAPRRSSIAVFPSTDAASAMTMWDPRASGNGRNAQRFQFYPARPLVAAALARPLSEEEVARRAALEAKMPTFAEMHAGFAPVQERPEQQEKEETEMGNNELESLEEQERRAADDDESAGFPVDDELLDFDLANLTESVRTLMSRIKSESLLSEAGVPVECATTESNQDDDGDDDEEVDCVDDVDDLELDNNARIEHQEATLEAQIEQELAHELSPVERHLLQQRRNRLLSCAAEQAAVSARDQLTSSVRRLVIELKDDSDGVHKPLARSQGVRRNTNDIALTRRRAGSCPASSELTPNDVLSPSAGFPLLQSTMNPPLVPEDSFPSKKHHKKSAFARIGPRVLETLHLRKKRKTYLFTDQELESIEGARWKIVELAFRFGGKHRTYLVQAINMFFPLLKYGRRGGAHATRLHCNLCGTIQWQHKRGGLSGAVDLAEVLQVLDGRQTAVFRKYTSSKTLEACSFSVVFRGRTLDLETQSSSHRDWLVSALRTLVAYARRQRRIEQQAIAERAILPLEDDVAQRVSVPTRTTAPMAHRRREDSPMMAALPPNYTIRTVY